MEKVTGIGGFFFRAKDPAALARWYEEHLGVNRTPTTAGAEGWKQAAGDTAFEPFPVSSDFFGDSSQQWMLNFRVPDLHAMVEQLRAGHIEVEADPVSYPYGWFARLKDPEGNPIQLWQPV